MDSNLESTIITLDDFHRGLPTGKPFVKEVPHDERTYKYLWMARWLSIGDYVGEIDREFFKIDELLTVSRRGSQSVQTYVKGKLTAQSLPNTLTCGFFLSRIKGDFINDWRLHKELRFHNETVPDYFQTILGLAGETTPFVYTRRAGITTPYLEHLQEEAKQILERCRKIKFDILDSNPEFSSYYPFAGKDKYSNLNKLMLLYLQEEAKRIESLESIAKDMKSVYGSVIDILSGVLERARSRGDIE